MNTFRELWSKFRSGKKYREEFVAAQVKRGIPFQIRALMKKKGFSQERLAELSGSTQGVVSRAANPNYGNLTLNTIIRIAAGFDVAFAGRFVPFSELGRWFINLSEESVQVPTFDEENAAFEQRYELEEQGPKAITGAAAAAFRMEQPGISALLTSTASQERARQLRLGFNVVEMPRKAAASATSVGNAALAG